MAEFTFASSKEGFDNHISASIRGYDELWGDVLSLSQYFVEDDTRVYDLGCSTGKLISSMEKQNRFAQAIYYGIEMEDKFLAAMEPSGFSYDNGETGVPTLSPDKRFKGNPAVQVIPMDIREVHMKKASLITSIFTLQFMPVGARQKCMDDIFDALMPGGGFIFAEKTRSPYAEIHDMRTFTHYDYKRQNFKADEILDKEKTLRHLMKPNTHDEIMHMLDAAGFRKVDTFWQNFAFVGYIAIK